MSNNCIELGLGIILQEAPETVTLGVSHLTLEPPEDAGTDDKRAHVKYVPLESLSSGSQVTVFFVRIFRLLVPIWPNFFLRTDPPWSDGD